MRCKGRYCVERKELKFPIISGYFTERRCSASTSSNTSLCEECIEKSKRPFVSKNQQAQFQGKIDEPYFENSWLFGSPRFLRYAAIPGNALGPAEFKAAEDAQRIARQGIQMVGGCAPQAQKADAEKTQIKKASPRRKPKKVDKVKSIAMESSEEPIVAERVVKIKLDVLDYKEVRYWHDTMNDLVYQFQEGGKIGGLVGRWNRTGKNLIRIFQSLEREECGMKEVKEKEETLNNALGVNDGV